MQILRVMSSKNLTTELDVALDDPVSRSCCVSSRCSEEGNTTRGSFLLSF